MAAAAAEAIKTSLPEVLASMKSGTAPAAGVDEATQAMFRAMALSFAEISDQGTQRKRVAPEILERRNQARERMIDLIMEARANGDKPEYKVISKTYLNERLIQPFTAGPDKVPVPTQITWTGEPSDGMRPVNAIAKKIFAEFRASRGSTEALAKEDKRPYWLTAGGLVVKGDPPPRRELAVDPRMNFVDDLSVSSAEDGEEKNQNDPNATFINVLGTVADPARQNYQGKAI